MKLSRKTLAGGLLACITGLASPALSAQDGSDRIHFAANYLLSIQRDNGLFRYEYDFLRGDWTGKTNIVRQAGTGYALAEYLRHDRSSPKTVAAVRRAIAAYASRSIPWKDGILVTHEGRLDKAKGGATALALLSALFYREATRENEFDAQIHAWLKGLAALRLDGGGFAKLPASTESSPYSDGEIWLALATFAHVFPDNDLAQTLLTEVDSVFLKQYGDIPDIGFFHWGVMAAVGRFRDSGERRFLHFARDQVQHYIDEMRPRVKHHVNSCYAVEGMASALQALTQTGIDPELAKRLASRVYAEMEKNRDLQVKRGQDRITLGQGRFLVAPELERFTGAYLNGKYRPQTRIDFTQHCLSAELRMVQLSKSIH